MDMLRQSNGGRPVCQIVLGFRDCMIHRGQALCLCLHSGWTLPDGISMRLAGEESAPSGDV